ncbi:23s rrna methyltransferase [Stylonychia lemnae]|uniref:rRNA methyltransferase 2, mitochondrial n=1 Tax=Stylonychia lemnae TaxID=5949 RepID=A0A078BEN8_STYLE|nr:23s rrna methyltransferase [Stylonychia lemnae]|eukprot:CDW91622.1 23s rrna methyltransferase [Stylonychia lemnae]
MLAIYQRRFFSEIAKGNLKGSAKKWMDRHVNDQYVKQANLLSYRSRAAFKLLEMDKKYQLFRKGMKVVDVGAAPGGWSQIIASRVDSKPGQETVVAVDLIEMDSVIISLKVISLKQIKGVLFVHGDIQKDEIQEKISEKLDFEKADVVCSDAVPDLVGERFVDHMKAIYLNQLVVNFCESNLKKGGTLLMKTLQGPSEQDFFDKTKYYFDNLSRVKPSASRSESKEIYFLGKGFEESKDPKMQEVYKLKKKLESATSQKETNLILKELSQEIRDAVMKDSKEFLKKGGEFPDELKSTIKNIPELEGIDLQQKMSLRDKQKAQMKAKQEEDKEFEDKTGILDKSKHLSVDNLISQYEHDMRKNQRKEDKMYQMDKEGIEYDPDEIVVTDDEEELKFNLKKEAEKYEDDPYKHENPEKFFEEEYKRIEDKLKSYGDQVTGEDTQSETFDKNKELDEFLQNLDEYERIQNKFTDYNQTKIDQQLEQEESQEYLRVSKEQQKSRDAHYERRKIRYNLKKTGGVKQQSPVWDDNED